MSLLAALPDSSIAGVDCSTQPECQATGTIGSLGGPTAISPLGTTKSGFTTIRFPASDYEILVGSNTSITDNTHKNWQYVYMGDASLTSNVDVTFYGSTLQVDNLVLRGFAPRTVGMSQLDLTNVNLDVNSIKLDFQGSDNQINLTNSNIDFINRNPEFNATAPLAINVRGGDNTFTGFTGLLLPTAATIDLQPGSTLNFFGSFSGSLSADTRQLGLYFGSPVNGRVDNAKLKFQESNVYLNSSSFNFINNSQLELETSGTRVEFEYLSFDNSQANIGGATSLKVNKTLTLSDTTVTMGSGATLDAQVIEVNSDSVLSGDTSDSTQFLAGVLELKDNVSLSQNGANTIAENLFLQNGSVFNVNNGNVQVTDTLAKDGTINLNNGSTYSMTRGFYLNRNVLTLNIDATSRWNVGSKATMITSSTGTVINNDGQFNLSGYLWGNGNFSGSGEVIVKETGQISPGIPRLNEIGIFTFDNTLKFTNQGAQGDQSQSQYLAHIGVVGGVPGSDLLQYNNNNVDTTGLTSIKVEMATANSATDLDGQTFTIIASKDAASTGTIITGGSYPAIVEGGSIPALVDFTLFDNNTNGNSDFTLSANSHINNLAKNPLAQTRNRQGSTALLVNAVNSGNTAVTNSLNTLTNSQLPTHLDSIHAEPYSSYMTVSLEQTDMVMNTVQNRAVWGGVFGTAGSSEVTQSGTLRRTWMEGVYIDGEVEGDGDLGNFDYTLTGLTIGQDLLASPEQTLGFYLSFGKQDMDEHDRAVENLDGDMYHLGLYLNQANFGGWDLRGVLGYAYGDHSSKRSVLLSGSSTSPSADFNSHSIYGGIKGTINAYKNQWVTLSPELGLNYIYYDQESFSESGDPNLSLKVDAADAQAVIASAGLNARFASFSETTPIYPVAYVRYEHDFFANDNNEHEIDAALLSHPDQKQTFVGQNRGENAVIMGVGLGSEITSALQLKGGLLLTKDTHGSEWGAGFNMEYHW